MKKNNKLDILYEDKSILIVNKPSGLLTISTLKEKENTLYSKVYDYLKKKNKNNKVFIVHRLDKDTSGLLIFAKDINVKKILQDNWESVKREYIAIVHGITKDKEILQNYLKETSTNLVYIAKKGDLAITEYEKIKSNTNYSYLRINIKTGKKHQIRVQLNNINHPIVGDKKYSDIKDKSKRLMLHAYKLTFNHPVTKEKLIIETKIPKEFNL